ncbi:MAG: MFS transporter [Acidobacteriota bacterium]
MTQATDAHIGYWQLLYSNQRVRRLWSAQVISELGDWLNFVALLQLINKFSASAQAAGGLIIIQMLSMVVFSPLGGILADRFNRRTIMIVADLIRAVVVLGFLLIDQPNELWLLYLLAGIQFSVTALFEPARAALVPSLAKREELVTTNALTSVTWSIILAIGGTLGGVIAGLLSNAAAFIIDAVSFVISALLLVGLDCPVSLERENRSARSDGGLSTALSFLRKNPRVLAVLLVKSGLCVTAGGVWLLSVVYGQRVFPVGDGALSVGLLYGACGIGSVVGATLTSRLFYQATMKPVRAIMWAFAWRSVFFLCWGLAPNIGLVALAIICVNACGSLLWVVSTTLLQRLTPDEIRGRLFALEFAALTFTMALSIWLIGRALDVWQFSPSHTTIATALAAVVIAAIWFCVLIRWSAWQRPSEYGTQD